jgi:hypothetical protein
VSSRRERRPRLSGIVASTRAQGRVEPFYEPPAMANIQTSTAMQYLQQIQDDVNKIEVAANILGLSTTALAPPASMKDESRVGGPCGELTCAP